METKITCNCTHCNGKSAWLKGDGTVAGRKASRTAIHNFVRLAHSPLSRSATSTVRPA